MKLSMRFLRIALLLFFPVWGVAQAASSHQLTLAEARQMAAAAARHDHIDLSDTHIEFASMDTGAAFIRGFASFIVIRESETMGPDETLRRYAVNRHSGNVWEMTLCTRSDSPELTAMRRHFTGRAEGNAADATAEEKQLGCTAAKQPTS
jgi:Effector immunity protein Tgi2PP